jgi:hypothetical protein
MSQVTRNIVRELHDEPHLEGRRITVQKDQTLSAREVGDIVHEISTHLDQSRVTLEYISDNWL